jgi:hypothetical protein
MSSHLSSGGADDGHARVIWQRGDELRLATVALLPVVAREQCLMARKVATEEARGLTDEINALAQLFIAV